MDLQQLIELIQERKPDGLTDRRIADIKATLAKDPQLLESLLEEFSIDPNDGAPELIEQERLDEITARLEALAADRKGKCSPLLHLVLLALVAAAIWGAIQFKPRRDKTPATGSATTTTGPKTDTTPASTPATKPATAPATRPTTAPSTKPSATQPATAPATRPGPDKTATQPATQPAEPVISPASFPLEWRDYALPGSKDDSAWRANIAKLFIPQSGAREPKFSRHQKHFELNGSYRLGSLPKYGQMLRLDFKSARTFNIEFSNADHTVRIVFEPSKRIRMVSTLKKGPDGKPAVIDSADDYSRWQNYRCYAPDIRHQDGRMIVCRGEVPLLSVAMPKAPTEGKLDCSSTSLNLGEARVVRPLAIPERKIDPATIRKTNAAAFQWTLSPADKKTEEVELIVDKAKGTVSVENRIDYIHSKASFAVPTTRSMGVEVTVHITEFHPSTIITLQSEMGSDYLKFDAEGDRFVISQSDRRRKAEALAMGQSVGKEFWVRFRIGGDLHATWISPDSKRWWLRQAGQSTTKASKLTFGFELPTARVKGKGPRRTTVGSVTVRRFGALTRLADPKLVDKAFKAMTEKLLASYQRTDTLAALAPAGGKDVPQREWLMACNTVLATEATHWAVRRDAMRDVLLDAIELRKSDDTPRVLSAISEISEVAWPDRELGPIQHMAFEALGRRCLENGQPDAIQGVIDASYMSHIGRNKALILTPNLLREHIYSLMGARRWDQVRREAMRAIYHTGSTNAYEERHILPLILWALGEARANLPDESDPKTANAVSAWRHPLIANDDREMLNSIGEFMFLVKGKHYPEACKAITARSLSDDLVALGNENQLLQSSHFRIREVIRTTPELRRALNDDYSDIGMIRLERARRQNDLAALKSIAVQFYGTKAGFGAMHILADRDLSNGGFWAAAAQYKLLADEKDYSKRSDAAAKFRLASAMLGKSAGKPADKPVELPGETFSAKEFEQMISRLIETRKPKPRPASQVGAMQAPAPGGNKARATHLATLPGERFPYSRTPLPHQAAFAASSDRLVISLLDKLTAIDLNSRKISWSYEPDKNQRNRRKRTRHGKNVLALATRPLIVDDKLFVRTGEPGRPLTCMDAKTGKVLWSKVYDSYVLSDPIRISSWVSVITARQDGGSDLRLNRVSGQTGESSMSSRLVRIRDLWPAVGRPAVVGDSLLFRSEGCLVNCSLEGSVRWAARLSFVPATASPMLHADHPLDDMIPRNENLILTLPGNPYITCVSTKNAKTIWKFLKRPSARILGLHSDGLVVVESDRIYALNPDTGKLLWRRRHQARVNAVCPAAKDTLLTVCLARPKPARKNAPSAIDSGRLVRWISARTGQTVKEIPIEGDPSIYHAEQITSDGRRIYGLSNQEHGKLPRIFVLDISN